MPLKIIVAIDGLGARFLGPYGNAWITTPAFNELASYGEVFDSYFAETDNPNANFLAMVTGRRSVSVDQDSLPIQQANRHLISDHAELAPELQACFETIESVVPIDEDNPGEVPSYEVPFSLALDWLNRHPEQDNDTNQLWIHCRGLLGTWNAPTEYQSRFKDESDPEPTRFESLPNLLLEKEHDPDDRLRVLHAYAAEITWLDECLGTFIEALAKSGLDIQLALVGTVGCAMGEHLEIGNIGETLHSEKLHVPLMTRSFHSNQPNGEPTPPRRYASLADSHELQTLFDSSDKVENQEKIIFSLSQKQARIQTAAWAWVQPLRESRLDEFELGSLFAKPDDYLEINEVSTVCPDIAKCLSSELAHQVSQWYGRPEEREIELMPEVFGPQ